MTGNDLNKSKRSNPEKKPLETPLRKGLEDLDAAVRNKHWLQPASTLDRESASKDLLRREDNWSQNFEMSVLAPKRQKSLFGSALRYFGVAIVTGGISGAALLYMVLHYYDARQPEMNNAIPYTTAGGGVATRDDVIDAAPSDQTASSGAIEFPDKAADRRDPDLSRATANDGAMEAGSSASLSGPIEAKPKEPEVAAKTAALVPSPDAALPPAPALTRQEDQGAKPAEGSNADLTAARRETQSAKLPPDQEDKMLKRASALMGQNDIAGARLIFQYLANHASPRGAFALAESYDPQKWGGHHVAGMSPDAGLARTWYARAAELGSKEAAAVLRKDRP